MLLGKIKEMHPNAPVVIITGYSDVKDAVDVMKLGAYDYVTKPMLPDEILLTIKKALAADKSQTLATGAAPSMSRPAAQQQIMGQVMQAKPKLYLTTSI